MAGRHAILSGPWPRRVIAGALILGAGVLAVLLRLEQARASLVFDEYASLYFADQPWHNLWGRWLLRETNPPLFYSLLKLWRMITPATADALRLLPLLLSLAQIGLLARFAGRTYGWVAALACVLLFALSPSDIYQSAYVRGYALAKLAITISFIGLVRGLERDGRAGLAGWLAYALGAVVAIYSHTTLVLWPIIAGVAVLAEAAWGGKQSRAQLWRLLAANVLIAALAARELWFAAAQLHDRGDNIAWIKPLATDEFITTANLQLLLGGSASSALMAGAMALGAVRTWRCRTTRMALVIAVGAVAAFKAADSIHPVMTDFTLHWAATFTTLLAAAAFASAPMPRAMFPRWAMGGAAAALIGGLAWDGLVELREDGAIPHPQDWRAVVNSAARTPGAGLLASHESIGVVVQQACALQFHGQQFNDRRFNGRQFNRGPCPFPLVVLQNPARSDSWADGGYRGALVAPAAAGRQLRGIGRVFVFSRYVYTPLAQLGIREASYARVDWDDGTLIGPIPGSRFPAKPRI